MLFGSWWWVRRDLIHPHHDNELIQSQAAACDCDRTVMPGGRDFVRFWMHVGFVNGEEHMLARLCCRPKQGAWAVLAFSNLCCLRWVAEWGCVLCWLGHAGALSPSHYLFIKICMRRYALMMQWTPRRCQSRWATSSRSGTCCSSTTRSPCVGSSSTPSTIRPSTTRSATWMRCRITFLFICRITCLLQVGQRISVLQWTRRKKALLITLLPPAGSRASKSVTIGLPVQASNRVFYLYQTLADAADALSAAGDAGNAAAAAARQAFAETSGRSCELFAAAEASLLDDLNTPQALAHLSEPLKTLNDLMHTKKV